MRHSGIVVLAEVFCQEEVAVFFVVGHVELEGRHLCAALRRYALRRRVLTRNGGLQFQFAELHVGTYTEQTGGALYQRVVAGEGDVTSLDELDDFVLLAVIVQLQVLRVKVEGGVGVVVQRHVYLVAYLTRYVQIDFLVEVDGGRLAVTLWQRGVVDVLQCGTQLQFGRSLRFDANTARTEYLLCRTQVEVHIGKRELLLALRGNILSLLLAEEGLALAAFTPLVILLGSHQDGGVQIRVANLRTDAVVAQRVVVFHLLLDVLGQTKVES